MGGVPVVEPDRVVRFTDCNAPAYPYRFYRTVSPCAAHTGFVTRRHEAHKGENLIQDPEREQQMSWVMPGSGSFTS